MYYWPNYHHYPGRKGGLQYPFLLAAADLISSVSSTVPDAKVVKTTNQSSNTASDSRSLSTVSLNRLIDRNREIAYEMANTPQVRLNLLT